MEPTVFKNYFAIIPAPVRYDKNVSPNAKLLYGEITSLTNEKGYCWASNNYFADLYQVSKNSISTWISQLQKAGHITVDLIYKPGTKEIQNRYIRITGKGIQENLVGGIQENLVGYPRKLGGGIQENLDVNNKSNNTYENASKDAASSKDSPTPIIKVNKKDSTISPKEKKPLSPKQQKKVEDIMTMRSMTNAYTENTSIRRKLNEYFEWRLSRGLQPNQWKLILDDLREYAGEDAEIAKEKINSAIASGFMQIISLWEKDKKTKDKKTKAKFDNTSGRKVEAVVTMTTAERKQFEDNLAKDENGNLITF